MRIRPLLAAAALSLGLAAPAGAETVLRIAMTASDIPLTTGQPDQGAEGWRFMGYTAYDALINWDLSSADKPSTLKPALATSWSTDPADRRKWTFKLRQGVKFHDGSDFTADAVVWNFDKLLKKESPQNDPKALAQTLGRLSNVESYRKVDDYTFELVTKTPDALFPYYLTIIWYPSPAQWEKTGRNWAEFAKAPSGTGPWKIEKVVPRERAELVKNPNYWDKERVPKTDRMVLLPMPEAATRTAALLTGQVDWIEAPPPDAIPKLKSSGMQIVTNVYPHVWPHLLNVMPDSPFADVRVRQAANLALDRDGLVNLLGGVALPAVGQVPPGHPWFGNPTFKVRHDVAEAKRLLAEAGYGPNKPVKATFIIAPSGSGQMQPLQMNEFIQQNLKEVGIDISFEVMEWQALRNRRNAGAHAPENKGMHGINSSWTTIDPDFALINILDSTKIAPSGNNWGNVRDPVIDDLATKIRASFDPAEQTALIAQMHTRMVDQAYWLWVVHDLNPRALSPKVTGFVQAQNWVQDFSSVAMK